MSPPTEAYEIPPRWPNKSAIRVGLASFGSAVLPPALLIVYFELTIHSHEARDHFDDAAVVVAILAGLIPLNFLRMGWVERGAANFIYFCGMWFLLFGLAWFYMSPR